MEIEFDVDSFKNIKPFLKKHKKKLYFLLIFLSIGLFFVILIRSLNTLPDALEASSPLSSNNYTVTEVGGNNETISEFGGLEQLTDTITWAMLAGMFMTVALTILRFMMRATDGPY